MEHHLQSQMDMDITENEESDQGWLMSSLSDLEEGSSGGGGVDLTLTFSTPPSSMLVDQATQQTHHQPIMSDQNLKPSHINLSEENQETEGSLSSSSVLGLKLTKTASFINIIQAKLNDEARQQNTQQMPVKFRAAHDPASKLEIGSWQRISKNAVDLVAKFFYGRRKLAWEVLDGELKHKIEMKWDDISAISAHTPDSDDGRLEIQLNGKPDFFQESNPQPRKKTCWDEVQDFTEGQASICKHTVYFPRGTLKHGYQKLLESDQRLSELSNKPFPSHENPNFNQNPVPVFPPPLKAGPHFNAMTPRDPMSVTDPQFIDGGGRRYEYENQWGNLEVNNQNNQVSKAGGNVDYQNAPPHQGSNEGMDQNLSSSTYTDQNALRDQVSNNEDMDVNSLMNMPLYPNVELPEPTLEDFASKAARKNNDEQMK